MTSSFYFPFFIKIPIEIYIWLNKKKFEIRFLKHPVHTRQSIPFSTDARNYVFTTMTHIERPFQVHLLVQSLVEWMTNVEQEHDERKFLHSSKLKRTFNCTPRSVTRSSFSRLAGPEIEISRENMRSFPVSLAIRDGRSRKCFEFMIA